MAGRSPTGQRLVGPVSPPPLPTAEKLANSIARAVGVDRRRRPYSSVTVPLARLVTQLLAPPGAIAVGAWPPAKVPSVAPDGDSSVTVLSLPFTTHMFVPSNAIPVGPLPTAKVPSVAPDGDSSVTVLSPRLA